MITTVVISVENIQEDVLVTFFFFFFFSLIMRVTYSEY